MIPYQINDKCYFVDESFFFDNFDTMSEIEFRQSVMTGHFKRFYIDTVAEAQFEDGELIIPINENLLDDPEKEESEEN